MFATNHGGTPESEKAAILSKQFDLDIHTNQMLLSHTPMRQLLPLYQDKLVLVVGQTKQLTDTIMEAYVFEKTLLKPFLSTEEVKINLAALLSTFRLKL